MSVTGIGGSSSTTTAAVQTARDRLKALRSGEQNITKAEVQAAALRGGEDSLSAQLLGSFDSVDTDSNGLSFNELLSYSKNVTRDERVARREPHPRRPDAPMLELSTDELTSFSDALSAAHPREAEGIRTVLQNFSAADADANSKLSFDELRLYAEANGFAVPRKKENPATCGGGLVPPEQPAADGSTASTEAGKMSIRFIESALRKYSVGLPPYAGQMLSKLSA